MKSKTNISPPETDDPFLRDAQEGWSQFPEARSRWWTKKLGFSFFLFGRSWSWLPAVGKIAVGTLSSAAIITIAAVTIPFSGSNDQPVVVQNERTQHDDRQESIQDDSNTKDNTINATQSEKLTLEESPSEGNKHSERFFADAEDKDLSDYSSENQDYPVRITSISTGASIDAEKSMDDYIALPFIYIDQYRILDYDRIVTDLPQQKKEAPASLDTRFSSQDEKTNIAPSVSIDTIPYKTFVGDAVIKMKYGNYTDAEYQFKKLQVQYPDDENAIFYLGYCAFQKGEYVKAMGYFDKTMSTSLRAFASDAEWYKARVYLLSGDRNKAKTLLNSIIQSKGFYSKDAKQLLEKEFDD